jgi:hypothetical protein
MRALHDRLQAAPDRLDLRQFRHRRPAPRLRRPYPQKPR